MAYTASAAFFMPLWALAHQIVRAGLGLGPHFVFTRARASASTHDRARAIVRVRVKVRATKRAKCDKRHETPHVLDDPPI